jgi:hypothetical protein
MRLVSWVSIIVIACGLLPFFLASFISFGYAHQPDYQNVMMCEKYVIFGLLTLLASEIFRNSKNTTQEKSMGDHNAKN